MAPTVTKAPTLPSVPTETFLSGTGDQNNDQNKVDPAISNVTPSSDTHTNSAEESFDIQSKAEAIPKPFDPTTIIGFEVPILTRNLGSANVVREEGSIKVWQYHFDSCVVDFFFYPISKGASKLISKNWDMRNPVMGDRLDRSICLNEINLYHQKILSNS